MVNSNNYTSPAGSKVTFQLEVQSQLAFHFLLLIVHIMWLEGSTRLYLLLCQVSVKASHTACCQSVTNCKCRHFLCSYLSNECTAQTPALLFINQCTVQIAALLFIKRCKAHSPALLFIKQCKVQTPELLFIKHCKAHTSALLFIKQCKIQGTMVNLSNK